VRRGQERANDHTEQSEAAIPLLRRTRPRQRHFQSGAPGNTWDAHCRRCSVQGRSSVTLLAGLLTWPRSSAAPPIPVAYRWLRARPFGKQVCLVFRNRSGSASECMGTSQRGACRGASFPSHTRGAAQRQTDKPRDRSVWRLCPDAVCGHSGPRFASTKNA